MRTWERACCAHGFLGSMPSARSAAASAATESPHSSLANAAIARKSGSSACAPSRRRMCARNRGPHVLLAKHVIEELRDLGGQEIARPLGGDRLQRLDRAQIVVAMPERERPMERALARVHRER